MTMAFQGKTEAVTKLGGEAASLLVGQRRWNIKLSTGLEVKLPEKSPEIAAAQLPKPPVDLALERARVLDSAPAFLPVPAIAAERADEGSAASVPSTATAAFQPFDPGAPMISVVLEFLGALRDLPALGVLPLGRAGHVVAAYANVAALGRLHAHPAVLRLEEGRSWALPAPTRPNVMPKPARGESPDRTAVAGSPGGLRP